MLIQRYYITFTHTSKDTFQNSVVNTNIGFEELSYTKVQTMKNI